MLALFSYLSQRSGLRRADTADHVMVHADLSPATEKVIVARLNEYNIILATTRLLLGVNISNVSLVIFAQPFDQVEAVVQGGGRGGRKRSDGLRSTVQVSSIQFIDTILHTHFISDTLSGLPVGKQRGQKTQDVCRDEGTANNQWLLKRLSQAVLWLW